MKEQAPLAVRRRLSWSVRADTAQPTRPAGCGPSSVSTKNGPASVPTTIAFFSAVRTIVPLAVTGAKALNVWTSSWATAGAEPAAATRQHESRKVRRIVFMVVISALT